MDGQPRLLDQVREQIRLRHYSIRTERVYCEWVKRFIRFYRYRHPAEMAAAEVEAFLSDLAVRGNVSASTQNQALSALLFLYKQCSGWSCQGWARLFGPRSRHAYRWCYP
nr:MULTISPECIES: phage integrase N-terminal SAM-like domain-containing protein [Pseudomonas]